LVSIGPSAPAALLTSIVTSGVTAFLIIMAMTFGLILRACCSSVCCRPPHEEARSFNAPQRRSKIARKPAVPMLIGRLAPESVGASMTTSDQIRSHQNAPVPKAVPAERVLIVGGGFAVSRQARPKRADVEITLIDRVKSPYLSALLYQVATAVLSPPRSRRRSVSSRRTENLSVLLADLRASTRNSYRSKTICQRWRPKLEYDFLVIATGMRRAFRS